VELFYLIISMLLRSDDDTLDMKQ